MAANASTIGRSSPARRSSVSSLTTDALQADARDLRRGDVPHARGGERHAELAQVAQLHIHRLRILTKTNEILDVWITAAHPGVMPTDCTEVTIRPLAGADDADAFRTLNEEWIVRHFALEDEDRRQLADPVGAYVAPGGQVLMAHHDGRPVGCVAIVPDGTGAWEVSKMAVAPEHRGHGTGRRLLRAAIAWAQERGATSLFLGSSTDLAPAVRLYESVGFVHVPPETLHMPYARATVWMRMALPAGEG